MKTLREILPLLATCQNFTVFDLGRVPLGFRSVSWDIYSERDGEKIKTTCTVEAFGGVYRWEKATLNGFDAKRNRFENYLSRERGEFESKAGAKALIEWLKGQAVIFKGIPCPSAFFWFEGDKPFVSRF